VLKKAAKAAARIVAMGPDAAAAIEKRAGMLVRQLWERME